MHNRLRVIALIAVGSFFVGWAPTFVLSGVKLEKIAKELDSKFKLKEKASSTLETLDNDSEMGVLLRNDLRKEIEKIDISKHKRQQIDMFGGEVNKVTFVASKTMLDVIFDRFGNMARLTENEDGTVTCTVEVQVGQMLIAWLCSFDTRIKVVSPPSVVSMVKEHLEKTLSQY